MPRNKGTKEYRTFVGGLVTEASPLTFPDNASYDEDNCYLRSDGSRRRRLGMNLEEGGANVASVSSTEPVIVSEYLWTNVAAQGDLTFRVVQVDDTVHFFESNDTDALSDNKKSFTVKLSDYDFTKTDSSTSDPSSKYCSFVSGKGVLVIVNPEMDPVLVKYDPSADTITDSKITIQVRDFTGVDDGLGVNERPSTLSDAHEYNLLNQGWRDPENPSSDPLALVDDFFTDQSVYPSNSDLLSTGYERFINSSNNTVVNYSPGTIVKAQVGTGPAPKGSVIYDPFVDDRDLTGTAASLKKPKDVRPSVAAFFSGRIWYGGVDGNIYFSQILDDDVNNIGKCYQSNDPTSIEAPDLLADDGGVIKVPEATRWKAAAVSGTSIMWFASNGVWQVSGVDNYFKATDVVVNEVTRKGLISERGVTDTETAPVWLSEKGLHTINIDEISKSSSAVDVTGPRIQTFTDDIPIVCRKKALVTYDSAEKVVVMLYSDDSANPAKFNKQINVSLKLEGAIFPWSFGSLSSNSPILLSACPVEREYNLVTGKSKLAYTAVQENTTSEDWDLFFAVPNNRKFRDWQKAEDDADEDAGANYVSYIETGYDTFDDIRRDKSIDDMFVYLKRTETAFIGDDTSGYTVDYPSSCTFTIKYDFTDDASASKWYVVDEVYRRKQDYRPADSSSLTFNNGYPVNIVKESLRGDGRAVQFRFESSEGKDFHLLGWAVDVSVGQRS